MKILRISKGGKCKKVKFSVLWSKNVKFLERVNEKCTNLQRDYCRKSTEEKSVLKFEKISYSNINSFIKKEHSSKITTQLKETIANNAIFYFRTKKTANFVEFCYFWRG